MCRWLRLCAFYAERMAGRATAMRNKDESWSRVTARAAHPLSAYLRTLSSIWRKQRTEAVAPVKATPHT